ncbi:MAG TPA: phosphatase PAP2 family protein [Solirubrobacteraceae bacterium]|jgi:membrane-associated phospholipid phosphatase|nr:phosphatase PAP2 family protein [Solirubrobacteraceae bacterium]
MRTSLPRRARISLAGAGVGIVLLAVTWYLAHYVAFLRRVDVNILLGFAQLDRPGLDRVTNAIASSCDPQWYALLVLIPLGMAVARRRLRLAVMIAIVLLAANETTELLKPLLTAPRDPVWWSPIGDGSWPSGHATASMTLALCTVVAAPARRRPAVAAAMAAFSLAVCYSFLELGWHYPSDVFGGFLVASTWTLLGIAVLTILDARRSASEAAGVRSGGLVSVSEALIPMAVLLGAGVFAVLLVILARPHAVIDYAHAHTAFVVGAGAIAALGLLLASGLTLMLRRG